MAAALKRLHQAKFLLRKDAGVDGEIVGADAFGDFARRADRPIEPDRMGDGRGGRGGIAGDHDGAHAERAQFGQQRRANRPAADR